jgi:2-methylcitrate dehydratase PrpD
MVPIVCEPVEVKKRPSSDYHAKFSLQYSVAAAIVLGELGVEAYTPDRIQDAEILGLAERVEYEVDSSAPDTRIFKGWIVVETSEGRYEEIVDANWGSSANPMTPTQVQQKFERNVESALPSGEAAKKIVEHVAGLDEESDIRSLLQLCWRVDEKL